MAGKIFISYRRDDSAGHAGRVHDRLEREYGRDLLFMDVDAIPLGADFVRVLSDEVAKCDVLLAIVGSHWIDARDEYGNLRLESETDFVRIEIAAALKRDIPIIPILLEGTRMPQPEQLPDDLKPLARRQALDVRHASFHADVNKLIRGLRGLLGAVPPDRSAEGRIKVDCPPQLVHGAPEGWFRPGAGKAEWFQDIVGGPEMVVVPAGTFTMGSGPSEIAALREQFPSGQFDCEAPRRTVAIKTPFAVGRFTVTFDEWNVAVAEGACSEKWNPRFWGGREPASGLSWDDAQDYVAWLSRKTSKTYRLLSEAEWEYVCRAGTTTAFWWGNTISTQLANYGGSFNYGRSKDGYRNHTVPVDSFEPNPWGLYQVHGNVWEWCEDLWHDTYDGAPSDGSAWAGPDERISADGSRLELGPFGHVVRGGSWDAPLTALRATHRNRFRMHLLDYEHTRPSFLLSST
jgi:formylglycine-generating enzyme required for sulfatase activity